MGSSKPVRCGLPATGAPAATGGGEWGAAMMTEPTCGGLEIDKLVERINQASAAAGDPLGDLARSIQRMLQSEIDPYLLAGVLIEGTVQAVVRRVPKRRRSAVSLALLQLLRNRLVAAGAPLADDPRG